MKWYVNVNNRLEENNNKRNTIEVRLTAQDVYTVAQRLRKN